jgi:hypothetical protein
MSIGEGSPKPARGTEAYCSFCRKPAGEVGPIVEGPGNVYICEECAKLCLSLIDMERRRRVETFPSDTERTPSSNATDDE